MKVQSYNAKIVDGNDLIQAYNMRFPAISICDLIDEPESYNPYWHPEDVYVFDEELTKSEQADMIIRLNVWEILIDSGIQSNDTVLIYFDF